jgi:hypothetical protein
MTQFETNSNCPAIHITEVKDKVVSEIALLKILCSSFLFLQNLKIQKKSPAVHARLLTTTESFTDSGNLN